MKFEELVKIPDKFKDPLDVESGKVEQVFYKTKGVGSEEYEKYCYVYTPYGYDPEKEYDIIYQMHGGGEICDRALYKGSEPTYKKYVFDNMIKAEMVRPFIFVATEWYSLNKTPKHDPNDMEQVVNRDFHRELVEDIMPVIEAKYHTYADYDTSKEGLLKARDHRMLMGWSQGSITLWYVCMSEDMKYFKYFNPESGQIKLEGGPHDVVKLETYVERLYETLKANGISKDDFYFYMTTGTKDIAYPNYSPQPGFMKKHPDLFVFDGDDANCVFLTQEDGEHHTEWRRQYQYNAIVKFFGKE